MKDIDNAVVQAIAGELPGIISKILQYEPHPDIDVKVYASEMNNLLMCYSSSQFIGC